MDQVTSSYLKRHAQLPIKLHRVKSRCIEQAPVRGRRLEGNPKLLHILLVEGSNRQLMIIDADYLSFFWICSTEFFMFLTGHTPDAA